MKRYMHSVKGPGAEVVRVRRPAPRFSLDYATWHARLAGSTAPLVAGRIVAIPGPQAPERARQAA